MPFALTVAAVALAASCGAAQPLEEMTETPIAFETILDDSHSGIEEPLREVVRDEGRWTELWDLVHRGVSPRPPLPPVDFSRHMLLAVGLGTRRSGGFDVGVRRVAVRAGRLEVEVLETCPASDAMVGAVLTRPVEVVRVERLPQDVAFRDTRAPSCE